MNQNENQWDKLLKIKTTGRDDSRADQYRYPYEPTPYCVLERLANSGLISKKNVVLDYGTGKGRVCFFLSYQTRCSSIGVEYDDQNFRWRQSQSGTGRIWEKDFLRTDKCRRIPSANFHRSLLFLQPLFHRNPPKSPVPNLRILLRKPKGNPAVFLLSLRRIHQLPDDRRAVAVF